MYTFSSCRQAHQHRQLRVNLFFLLLELLSTPSPLQPPTLSHSQAASGQGRASPAGCRGEWGQWREKWPGSTLPWGQRERKRKVGPGERRAGRWRLEAQQRKGGGGYSLGGAGAGVEVGAGATSSVPSQFSCARGPVPGVVLGAGAGAEVWVGPGVGAEAGPGRWGLFMC